MLNQVPFNAVKIKDRFWEPRIRTTQDVTIDLCINKCEETGRIENFVNAANKTGQFQGIYFNDSDVYKVLEGVAYTLMLNRDPALEAKADEIIHKIAAAQQEDGYLMCYFIMGMEERWTNMERHEMYCAGHLIEAAIAYYQATGKDTLLNAAIRLADHLDSNFGPGKRHWVTGHQEVELALVKLYKCTGEKRYLKLAHFLLEERGRGHGKGGIWEGNLFEEKAAYCQDDKPVKDQERVSGHAVRAMYMYTGMTDVSVELEISDYIPALKKLWHNVVLQNMYITGGIGSSRHNEGFTKDYDLPNDTAYCETCASVGMVLWSDRLNNLWKKAVYANVLERAMYNGALAGVSLAGDKFFYVNPLSSKGSHHRQEWYDCSCCPTQVARFLPSVGGYVYRTSTDTLYVNMYVESEATIDFDGEALVMEQETNYPWCGKVEFSLKIVPEALNRIALRIPDWCKSFTVSANDKQAQYEYKDGYILLQRQWASGDKIVFNMEMPGTILRADARIEACAGKVAVQRGPLVYCAEEADNPKLDKAYISDDAVISSRYESDILGGVVVLDVHNPDGSTITMVPYYAWDNREHGAMEVWLPEKAEREWLYKG